MRIVSRILHTTDVRLMGLNCLGSVAAPIFRDPGSLEHWGYVEVREFEDLREKPIRASALMRARLTSSLVMSGSAM